jgi:hypothetical protein
LESECMLAPIGGPGMHSRRCGCGQEVDTQIERSN